VRNQTDLEKRQLDTSKSTSCIYVAI